MKYKWFVVVLLLGVYLGCGNDDRSLENQNNPYIPNYNFSYTINLSLPQFSNLLYPSNAVYINSQGVGVRGVYVFNTGSDYVAYEAACPNQGLSDCSTMELEGVYLKCLCDQSKYSLFSGESNTEQYPLLNYRTVLVNETTLKIYN